MSKHLRDISKFLSYVLRHEPQSIGITLDREGWANIGMLISGAQQHGKLLSRELIQEVVEKNDKNRFSISADGDYIRAAQGHSTEAVHITYPEKEPPEFLYHGTAMRFLESIQNVGLKPGERHYVHLSEEKQTAIAVGQRYGKPAVLIVEALRMHRQGFKFYQAENGVWLTNFAPARFISACGQATGSSSDKDTPSANTLKPTFSDKN